MLNARHPWWVGTAISTALFATPLAAQTLPPGPSAAGIQDPVLSALFGQDVRIPNTDQADGPTQLNVVGPVQRQDALGQTSLTGHTITRVASPNSDARRALKDVHQAAGNGDLASMRNAAADLKSILLGTTQGRIYDGFALLNYNQGALTADNVAGEYKQKVLRDTGLTAPGIDGVARKIWEVDVNMFWFDGDFNADTYLIRVPVAAHKFDTVRVNYKIYSTVREELSPATVLTDYRDPGSVSFPFKGLDSVWIQIESDTVNEITVDLPTVRHLRGVYMWGWRAHPPRVHFMQPIYEIVNAHTGLVELEPQGKSFEYRNRNLTLDGIGDAAPEKKMLTVANAVLNSVSAANVLAMLDNAGAAPAGTWKEWLDINDDPRQLPPEAWALLAAEGITPGDFGPYDFVTAYANNEMYGDGPHGAGSVRSYGQGEALKVKVINLDNHTHYYRNVDFGPPLHDDIANVGNAGSHSFEIYNFKPTYGAPKVAEMQWRAGWGFRPHLDVIQQAEVFPRAEDQQLLSAYTDGAGNAHLGYQYSADFRGGDFRFNPPPFVIGSAAHPSPHRLADGVDALGNPVNGLLVGQTTPGYGVAKMCAGAAPGFCPPINPRFNPHGELNFPPPPAGMGPPTMLRFPPFLRNPGAGGDIIAPTPLWKPFLWINPHNGTLLIDAADESKGYWADLTYAHGAPIAPGAAVTADIEAPRASGQVFYQFDDLFHDNAIFSPHPR